MGTLQLKLIQELLDRSGLPYDVSGHAAVYTSEEAAEVRGVKLKTGIRAIVLKTEKAHFVLGLIAADKKIDSRN